MEAAEKIAQEHIDNYHFLHKKERKMLLERIVEYSSYNVSPSRKYLYLRENEICFSDGIYKVFILDTYLKGFCLDKFKCERATNISAFETHEFDLEEHKYASLIAN
jgi:hypothetical protein